MKKSDGRKEAIMTKKYALKRIHNEVVKAIPNESDAVKIYIEKIVYMFFESLENDADSYRYTSTQNLKYAIAVNLSDLLDDLLEEARQKCK